MCGGTVSALSIVPAIQAQLSTQVFRLTRYRKNNVTRAACQLQITDSTNRSCIYYWFAVPLPLRVSTET